MRLPHIETIEIGHGFKVDLEIKDLGVDDVPATKKEWDPNFDYPWVQLTCYYPLDLLKLFDGETRILWRVPDEENLQYEGNILHVGWGTQPGQPDTRATTHRVGAHKVKGTSLANTSKGMRKSVVNAAIRIKAHLDYKAYRLSQREERIKKAREGTAASDPVEETGKGIASMIELT